MADPLTAGSTTQNGLVAESDFMYEAPDNTPDGDINADARSFIDQWVKGGESGYEQEAETPLDEGTETSEMEAAPEGEAEVEIEEPDPTREPEYDPKLARGIQRVVQRELAAKEREAAAEKKIAELKALQAELAQYKDLKSAKDLAEMADIDPLGMFKSLGKDPDTIIKLALAQQLGDAAPDKLKEFAREASTKREIAQLKAQLAQEAQARAAQEYFNTILGGASEYVTKSVGDSKDLPTLALVAKADPTYVRDEIMEEIVTEAKRVAATDPNGEPLAYSEAAKRVETRLSKLAKLLNVQNSMNSATKNVMKPAGRTPPSPKPPTKPLAPWKQTSNIEEQGLQEALRAYERAEAERKARRA